MSIQVGSRPPVRAPAEESGEPRWGRPNVVVLLERPNPAPWSLRQVAALARRLGADLLVASIATYDRRFDDLDRLRLQIAEDGVQEATARLIERGARAVAVVRLAADGDQALSASDLADHLDADLVVVLARRGSRLRLFHGSSLAHQLMRQGRRPLLVIPDHERRESWSSVVLELVRARAPEPLTRAGLERRAP